MNAINVDESVRWVDRNFTVERDNKRSLAFKGEMLAAVQSPVSGGRWQVMKLYRTIGGKFICQIAYLTQWDGESDAHEAEVCATETAVMEFYGHGQLAKELYAAAGIDTAVLVY